MNEAPSFTELVDIRMVAVDVNLPRQERILDFVKQIKNPFHYKCGKYRIRAHFLNQGPNLADSLITMMS